MVMTCGYVAVLVAVTVVLTSPTTEAFVGPSTAAGACTRRMSPSSPIVASSQQQHHDHHHHHHHGARHSSAGSSSPVVDATGAAAPPANMSVANQSSRKRRRRPMIGPAVWAAFKEEQKGVTRTLLGLPDEEEQEEEEGGNTEMKTSGEKAGGDEGAEEKRKQQKKKEQRRPEQRTTLGTFMMETRSRSPDMEAMVPIMKSVGKTCTAVSRLVRRAQLEGMAGLYEGGGGDGGAGGEGAGEGSESVNVQGEVQKELDVLSNSIFLTGFCQPHDMSCVASEEEESPRMCSAVIGEETHGGEYAAVFDPLDGSANIEAGLPCGTIFGILRTSGSAREGRTAGPSTIVLPGRRLVAAGYCLYGPSTKLVFTLGEGVFEFTLEGEHGDGGGGGGGGRSEVGLGGGGLDFVLSRSNIRIPRSGNIYSVNEANSPSWSEAIQDYFRDLKTTMGQDETSDASNGNGGTTAVGDVSDPSEAAPQQATVVVENQYAGALVADLHNILIHGGVFAYPADVRNPNGKLRLLYEGNPMAMVVEQAGGIATTGFEPIRDVRPQSVHHRIPAFFGSPDNVLPLLNPRYLHSKRK